MASRPDDDGPQITNKALMRESTYNSRKGRTNPVKRLSRANYAGDNGDTA